VSRNEGFIVITGEIGAGKTMVLRSLIEGLHGSNVITGHLVTTQLGAEDTLRMVGAAFGFRVKDVPKSELLITLEAFLISQTSKGKRCLLVVDEAQNLTPRAVEELRMLSATSSSATRRCCRASWSASPSSARSCSGPRWSSSASAWRPPATSARWTWTRPAATSSTG
jgi:type II secretory pathway predicted ATPase ExeA